MDQDLQELIDVAANATRQLQKQNNQLLADVRGNFREILPGLEGLLSGSQADFQQAYDVLVCHV